MYPYMQQYPNSQLGGINFAPGSNGFQVQPQQQRPLIFGRPVQRVEDIMANDVPMDGSSGFFPLSDGSAIIKKSWNSDGTIKTVKYVPEVCEELNTTSDSTDELKEWLNEKFDEVIKAASNKHVYTRKEAHNYDRSTNNGFGINKKKSTSSEQPEITGVN